MLTEPSLNLQTFSPLKVFWYTVDAHFKQEVIKCWSIESTQSRNPWALSSTLTVLRSPWVSKLGKIPWTQTDIHVCRGCVSSGGAPSPAGTSVFTKHNLDMGMGYLWLNGWGIYHLMGGAFIT